MHQGKLLISDQYHEFKEVYWSILLYDIHECDYNCVSWSLLQVSMNFNLLYLLYGNILDSLFCRFFFLERSVRATCPLFSLLIFYNLIEYL